MRIDMERVMTEKITSFVDRTSGALVVLAGLAVALTGYWITSPKIPESEAATVLASFLGVVGTIAGAFFGIKVGAAGGEKIAQKAEEKREKAEKMLNFLHGVTPRNEFDALIKTYPEMFKP
jgi:hypothetical protein